MSDKQKNNLIDLNGHLFAQLERLGNEKLEQEEMAQEVMRTNAIVNLSEQIINNAKIALDAAELVAKHGVGKWESMLPIEVNNEKTPSKIKQGIPDYAQEIVK